MNQGAGRKFCRLFKRYLNGPSRAGVKSKRVLFIRMNLSTYFSKQARRPEGLFGRLVMRLVFDQGNAFLNDFVMDLMSVQPDDRIIEIGSGTGKLIYQMARKIDAGCIDGVDFSGVMVSIARKRNKKGIARKRVNILEADFDEIPCEKGMYSKACSVNTLYFWPSPERTAKKLAEILTPDGKLILAFEDIEQLKRRNLNQEVFHLYSNEEVRDLLINAGFSKGVKIVTRKRNDMIFHCAVAIK